LSYFYVYPGWSYRILLMKMKRLLCILLLIITGLPFSFAQSVSQPKLQPKQEKEQPALRPKWTVANPGQTDVFIKNEGQYDYLLKHSSEPVAYVLNSNEHIFFTEHGYTIRLYKKADRKKEKKDIAENKLPEKNKGKKEEGEGETETESIFIKLNWEGANPHPQMIAENEADGYHTFAAEGYRNLKSKGYKKLTYKELYPGIDLEYIISDGGKINYNLILKPEADISKVSMHYGGELEEIQSDASGNIIIKTEAGDITSHAPFSNSGMQPAFVLNENSISFKPNNAQSGERQFNPGITIISAAWPVTPNLGGGVGPYDVDYDNLGNVYIDYTDGANGYNYISKYSSAGVFKWTIDLSPTGGAPNGSVGYADFVVIPSGSIFIASGFLSSGNGGLVSKISPAGSLVATKAWPKALNLEGWVMNYNKCSNVLLVGGGGTNNYVSMRLGIDTSLAGAFTGTNFNGASEPGDCGGPCYGNDLARMLIDDNGDMYSYFASNPTVSSNNQITKSVSPYTSKVYNYTRAGCSFDELTSIPGPDATCNRLNVMDINSSYLYFFDGEYLEAHNKANGNLIASIQVSAAYTCGGYSDFFGTGQINAVYKNEGIAVDACNNVYVGGQSKVHEFSFNGTSFTTLPTIAVPNNVYDIMLDKVNHLLYVVGKNFVTSLAVTPCSSISLASPSSCGSGPVTVTVTGGTAPFTYSWSNGATTNPMIAGPGTYSVTVTDASCNKSIQQAVLTVPVPVTASSSSIAATCGKSNGQVSSIPGGGTAGYSYSWSNGAAAETVTSLAANTYTVTITDSHGCTATSTTTIANNAGVTAAAPTVNNLNCNGKSTGTATGVPSGGTPGYTYSWSQGAATQTISNLAAATYTVTITDANGCTSTTTAVITQPATAVSASYTSVNSTCSSNNNGQATASGAGGTAGYAYSWNTGAATNVINGLASGSYTVTVTDAKGCTTTTTAIVNNTSGPLASISASSSVKCFGQATGSATATQGGGTPGFSYTWSPSGGAANVASNLAIGTYTVTIKDANNCTSTSTTTITQPAAALSAAATPVSATCGKANGTASVLAGGGTVNYTYLWTTGSTSSSISAVVAGAYSVTVTDSKGCTQSATANIGNSAGPTLSVSASSNVNCFGQATGSISTLEVNGTPGFSYTWAPSGGAGSSAAALAAGTYTVTITDANGCTSTTTQLITQPASGLTAATTPISSTCTANNNGQASVLAGGGTAGYAYQWTTGGTNSSISGLASGTYTVTVTDTKGCTKSATVAVGNTPGPVASANAVANVSCNRLATGSADALTAGGTPGFTYIWFPGGTTGANVGTLTANTYTVSVTDANGCTSTSTVTITQPPPLIPTGSSISATCGNPDGSVSVSTAGGTPNYFYSWSTGATSQTVTGLAAKSYTVTVTDSKGCTNSVVQTVNNAGGPTVGIAGSVNLICNGFTNGSVSATISGASPPFNFAWSNGTTGSTGSTGFTSSISGLTAGTYTLSVTDINGCLSSDNVTLTAPAAVSSSISSQTNAGCGTSNGQASVNVSGGNGGYIYSWSNGSTTNGISGVTANTYSLTITDSKGCTEITTVNITGSPAVTGASANVHSTCGISNGQASATPGGGTPGFSYIWSPGGAVSQTVTGLAAGSYTVTITDTKGCTATSSTIITANNGPSATISASANLTCNGNSGGSATVTASGGTANYTYAWSVGATAITTTISSSTTNQVSNLSAGIYGVTITDANGCSSTSLVSITQPGVLTPAISSTTPTCGTKNGSVSVNVSGGTPSFVYTWTTGNTGQTVNGLGPGLYAVTVTDGNGCTATTNQSLNNAGAPTVSLASMVNIHCNGGRTGSISVNVSGGTGALVYSWSDGASGVTALNGLTAGTYIFSATDANGCVSTVNTTLTNPPLLNPSIGTETNVSCGLSNGAATVKVTGGSGPYTYSWSNGSTTNGISGVTAATYTLTVTDSLGCTATQLVPVGNSGSPTALVQSSVNTACNGGATGSALINVTGGTPAYNYAWSGGGGILFCCKQLSFRHVFSYRYGCKWLHICYKCNDHPARQIGRNADS